MVLLKVRQRNDICYTATNTAINTATNAATHCIKDSPACCRALKLRVFATEWQNICQYVIRAAVRVVVGAMCVAVPCAEGARVCC